MAVKRATIEIESSGRNAYFDAEAVLNDPGNIGPALILEVDDFNEALDVVETLNRSRAQKKRETKPKAGDKPTPPAEGAQRAGEIAARLGGTNASGEQKEAS